MRMPWTPKPIEFHLVLHGPYWSAVCFEYPELTSGPVRGPGPYGAINEAIAKTEAAYPGRERTFRPVRP